MRCFVTIFLLFVSLGLSAQKAHFVNYGPDNGLASSSVYAITQDDEGLLWFGSRSGLFSFDGDRFRLFNEGLPASRVTSLTMDRNNRLWVGTAKGLVVMENSVFSNENRELAGRHIRALLTDSDGYVWAATLDSLIFKLQFKDGIQTLASLRYDIVHFEGDYPYQQLYEDSSGRIWSGGRIVHCQYIEDKRKPVAKHRFEEECAMGSYAEAGGILYGFSDYTSELLIIEGDEPLNLGRLPLAHASLLADSKGRIWAAGSYGLALVNTENPELSVVYRHIAEDPYSVSSRELYCIFEDNRGNIWIGGDCGLSVLCKELQIVKTVESPSKQVTSLMQASGGQFWIGTADRGAFVDGKAVGYPVSGRSKDGYVSCLYEDKDGTVYIGYWNNTGFDICKDGKTSRGKISGPVPVEQHPVAEGDLITSNWIADFLETSDRRFWIATWEGVGLNEFDRMNGKTLHPEWLSPFKYPTPDKDSSIYISSRLGSRLIEDKEGNLVYGTTEAGLNVIDRNTRLVTKYLPANSTIPDNYVTDLCIAPDGKIWAATRSGLWTISGEVYLKGKLVQSVEADDKGRLWAGTEEGLYFVDTDKSIGIVRKGLGLPSDIYGEHVSCKLTDGSLAFGGSSGAAVFHPDSLLAINAEGSLPLSFLLQHRYRLNNGNWVYKQFSGLPDKMMPGLYTVEEQSSDVFGRWEHGKTVSREIRVPMPLLLRWHSLLLYAVLLWLAIWLVIRFRERKTRQEIAKNLFYSIISHDLKGPVSDIRQLTDVLVKNFEGLSAKEIQMALSEIRTAASGTSDLLDNLLLWSLNQKQNLQPQLKEERLGDIVEAALSSVSWKNLKTQITGDTSSTILTDKNMLTTCLRNLVKNAVHYSPKGGTITINVTPAEITISDQGPGMDSEILQTLSRPGHLGLVITRELLERMGGSLKGRNLPEGGCEMTIELQ